MSAALVAHTGTQGAGQPSSITTPAINTTGATGLIIAVGWWDGVGNVSVSDSKSNTWAPVTKYVTSNCSVEFFTCLNPGSVGSGHTFSKTGTDTYGSIAVLAFSGTDTTASVDGNSGAGTASGTTQQPGSITPSQNGSVVITALGMSAHSGSGSIDGGFTVSDSFVDGSNYGVALAYLIQTSAAAANPTWTASSGALEACIISIKAAAGGAAGQSPLAPSRNFQQYLVQ